MRTPRDEWVEAGLRALAEGGPDAVRVEVLARRLGVTKGGFYGHFPDRATLLEEVLDTWERRSVDEVRAAAEANGGDALTRATTAGRLTFAPGLREVDLAVRDWTRRDASVAQRLRRVDNHRIGYLREQFAPVFTDPDELEARCFLAFCWAIAGDVIAADHPGGSREDVVRRAAALVFGEGGGG